MQDGTKKMIKNKFSLNNFIIPYFIIKSICRDVGFYPLDVSIEFSDKEKNDSISLCFNINSKLSRKQVNLTILNRYLNNFLNIHGSKLEEVVISGAMGVCSTMCDLYFDNSQFDIPPAKVSDANFPFSFISCKNIIYPYFNISKNNCEITCDPDSYVDFLMENNVGYFGIKNLKIEFRDAFIMMCLDEKYKKDNNDADGFIYRSFNNVDVMRMLFPFAVEYFNKDVEKADYFFSLIHMYSNSIASEKWINERFPKNKTARFVTDGNFWIYGLIEKMLAPSRGPDYTITRKWAPITNELWSTIDSARKKSGLSGANLEFMLSVKDHGVSSDQFIVQKLIEDLR